MKLSAYTMIQDEGKSKAATCKMPKASRIILAIKVGRKQLELWGVSRGKGIRICNGGGEQWYGQDRQTEGLLARHEKTCRLPF